MQLPKILQGKSLTRLLQGAFAGFLATVIIGFGWGGWTLWKYGHENGGANCQKRSCVCARANLRR